MLGVVSLQRLNIKTVHLHHNGYLEICFKISISNRRWISYIYDCENMLQTCCKHVDISLINVHRELINISI